MTILEHVGLATNRLVSAGLARDLAALDAEVLARHVLGWSRATYLGHRQDNPPVAFAARYGAMVDRREGREPVALITGQREFWGLEFEVTPNVLTPRPETELIVEEALGLVGSRAAPVHIADVGTGSGCLAVALASELPAARVTGHGRLEGSPGGCSTQRRVPRRGRPDDVGADDVSRRRSWHSRPDRGQSAVHRSGRDREAASRGAGLRTARRASRWSATASTPFGVCWSPRPTGWPPVVTSLSSLASDRLRQSNGWLVPGPRLRSSGSGTTCKASLGPQ